MPFSSFYFHPYLFINSSLSSNDRLYVVNNKESIPSTPIVSLVNITHNSSDNRLIFTLASLLHFVSLNQNGPASSPQRQRSILVSPSPLPIPYLPIVFSSFHSSSDSYTTIDSIFTYSHSTSIHSSPQASPLPITSVFDPTGIEIQV